MCSLYIEWQPSSSPKDRIWEFNQRGIYHFRIAAGRREGKENIDWSGKWTFEKALLTCEFVLPKSLFMFECRGLESKTVIVHSAVRALSSPLREVWPSVKKGRSKNGLALFLYILIYHGK